MTSPKLGSFNVDVRMAVISMQSENDVMVILTSIKFFTISNKSELHLSYVTGVCWKVHLHLLSNRKICACSPAIVLVFALYKVQQRQAEPSADFAMIIEMCSITLYPRLNLAILPT